MTTDDHVFAGSIPEIYDRLLVPLIFDPYARDLAARVAGLKPRAVLETAAGTGALTRAMTAVLPPDVQIVATDLNQPMLDRAAARMQGNQRVDWQQADALQLPFGDQSFDVVACQFGVMFFPDKVQGYSEARRVLRPGGTFLVSVWDRISENAFINVVSAALTEMFPGDPPSFMARTPHGFHDAAVIDRDLAAAGFASTDVETVTHMAHGSNPVDVATAYCQGTPLRAEIEMRGPGRLQEATHLTAEALRHAFGNGPIDGAIRAHIIAARA